MAVCTARGGTVEVVIVSFLGCGFEAIQTMVVDILIYLTLRFKASSCVCALPLGHVVVYSPTLKKKVWCYG